MTSAEELRAAAARLRETATGSAPLADWLESAAEVSRQHTEDLIYASDHGNRWCLSCNDEDCEGLTQVHHALAVARTIDGEVAS